MPKRSDLLNNLNGQARLPVLVRRPGLGLALAAVGLVLFAILLYSVKTQGPLIGMDEPLSLSLHEQLKGDPWFVTLFILAFSATGREGIILMMLLLAVAWIRQKRWKELGLLWYGLAGGEGLFQTLSFIIQRQRPTFPDPLEELPGPGFPSGHSLTSFVMAAIIVYLLWRRLRTPGRRALAVGVAAVVVSMIGFARLYMGLHFLTDVLAGYSAGLFWSALVFTLVELVYWKHHQVPLAATAEPVEAQPRVGQSLGQRHL